MITMLVKLHAKLVVFIFLFSYWSLCMSAATIEQGLNAFQKGDLEQAQ